MQLVTHAGASQREAALNILAPVSECVFEQLAPQLGTLLEVLRERLADAIQVNGWGRQRSSRYSITHLTSLSFISAVLTHDQPTNQPTN